MIVVVFGFDIPRNHFKWVSISNTIRHYWRQTALPNLKLKTARYMEGCIYFMTRHEICRVWEVSYRKKKAFSLFERRFALKCNLINLGFHLPPWRVSRYQKPLRKSLLKFSFLRIPLLQDIKMLLKILKRHQNICIKLKFLEVPLHWLLVRLFWPCEQESLIRQF